MFSFNPELTSTYEPLHAHLFLCVFTALITHVEGMPQAQGYTTLPVKELGADGRVER